MSRATTWENKAGLPGAGGQERGGRKGSPCIRNFQFGQTHTLLDTDGPGVVRHIWMTLSDRTPDDLRNMILRIYWDNSPTPSVEVPAGDFFGVAHGRTAKYVSCYTTMTLGLGFNCYFPMPFHKHARITLQNDMTKQRSAGDVFFQVDYELHDRPLPPNTGLFHAQFRRENPTTMLRDYVVLDGAEGPGYYIGCVIGVRPLGPHWWGEGEMKFYIDGDTDHPTICGTGTEDYFCAAWGMDGYVTPYHGCPMIEWSKEFPPAGLFSLYRWHKEDPVYFRKRLKATIQQIGYNKGLFERSDDWSSVAYWYQLKPASTMPALPDRDARIAGLQPAR